MKVRVRFFATFRELFGGGEKEVELEDGSTIQELLNLLCDSRQRRRGMSDRSDKLRPYIKILKNGRSIQFLGGIHTELDDGDVVAIFPPVGGG